MQKSSVADPDLKDLQNFCRIQIRIFSTDPHPDLSLARSVADPDPWNPYHFPGSGSVSNDTDPDPTKTIENIK